MLMLCSQDCSSLGFADLFCLGRPARPAVPASGTRLGDCRDAYSWLAAAAGLVLEHGATGFVPCFWGGWRKAFGEAVVMGNLSCALGDLGAGRRLAVGVLVWIFTALIPPAQGFFLEISVGPLTFSYLELCAKDLAGSWQRSLSCSCRVTTSALQHFQNRCGSLQLYSCVNVEIGVGAALILGFSVKCHTRKEMA